jgi:hypothetical protein
LRRHCSPETCDRAVFWVRSRLRNEAVTSCNAIAMLMLCGAIAVSRCRRPLLRCWTALRERRRPSGVPDWDALQQDRQRCSQPQDELESGKCRRAITSISMLQIMLAPVIQACYFECIGSSDQTRDDWQYGPSVASNPLHSGTKSDQDLCGQLTGLISSYQVGLPVWPGSRRGGTPSMAASHRVQRGRVLKALGDGASRRSREKQE